MATKMPSKPNAPDRFENLPGDDIAAIDKCICAIASQLDVVGAAILGPSMRRPHVEGRARLCWAMHRAGYHWQTICEVVERKAHTVYKMIGRMQEDYRASKAARRQLTTLLDILAPRCPHCLQRKTQE